MDFGNADYIRGLKNIIKSVPSSQHEKQRRAQRIRSVCHTSGCALQPASAHSPVHGERCKACLGIINICHLNAFLDWIFIPRQNINQVISI